MKSYVLVKIRAGKVKEVVQQLRKSECIIGANMTFGPYDAVAVLESAELHGLGNIIASVAQPIPGVGQTLTCLAVEV